MMLNRPGACSARLEPTQDPIDHVKCGFEPGSRAGSQILGWTLEDLYSIDISYQPSVIVTFSKAYKETLLFVLHKVQEFLWPRWGLDHGKKLLELLQSERFVSRPLLIHAFSIGGYTFAQLLVHVSQDTQKYQPLTQRIKGQVYDSLVVGSLETMATGEY